MTGRTKAEGKQNMGQYVSPIFREEEGFVKVSFSRVGHARCPQGEKRTHAIPTARDGHGIHVPHEGVPRRPGFKIRPRLHDVLMALNVPQRKRVVVEGGFRKVQGASRCVVATVGVH